MIGGRAVGGQTVIGCGAPPGSLSTTPACVSSLIFGIFVGFKEKVERVKTHDECF